MSRSQVKTGLLLATAVLAITACGDTLVAPAGSPPLEATVEHSTGGEYEQRSTRRARRRWLRQLRRATRPFKRLSVAQSSGYDVQATPCQESETGGMGYHFANFGLLDGTLEETRPEILLYEPRPGGREKLVAVEYAIPYTEWAREDDPPEIHGVAFNRNDVFQLWVMHAWVWKHNPDGTFASWNPRVSCRYDDQ